DGIGDVIQRFLPPQFDYRLIRLIGEMTIEAYRNPSVEIVRIELISRNLLSNEPIVGLVLIKRVDHVVAITPYIRARLVRLKTVGVGVSCEVQPVPAPALPVLRIRE